MKLTRQPRKKGSKTDKKIGESQKECGMGQRLGLGLFLIAVTSFAAGHRAFMRVPGPSFFSLAKQFSSQRLRASVG